MTEAFARNTSRILQKKYFPKENESDRPFTIYGYVYNGKRYQGGLDGIEANNQCGYFHVNFVNIYTSRIKQHFCCGHDVGNDIQLQLALRAINGLDINSLLKEEKEHAAKAVECGYLYREGETLYTKIPVSDMKDSDRLFGISRKLEKGYFEEQAQETAEKLAKLIKKAVPDYLLGEWRYVNSLAGLPLIDMTVEELIKKGVLTPPEDGIGAEGCWAEVRKD